MFLVPSSAPLYLELTVYSSTTIGFVWNSIPNSQRNGILLGYNVSFTWYDIAINHTQWNYTIVLPFTHNVLLERLQKYTTYAFSVCGFTSKGFGVWSKSLTGKTLSDGKSFVSRLRLVPILRMLIVLYIFSRASITPMARGFLLSI